MKILIITQKIDESDDVLGFFTSWVKAIAKRVDHVYVVCLAQGPYSLPKNVTVASLGKERGAPKLLQAILFYIYVLRFLPKVTGIFVHMAPEYVRALYPANIFFRKPIVMWYAHIRVSPAAKWAINHVNAILTPSKESFEYDSARVMATGHGINTELFSPRAEKPEFDIVSIGRISRVKRLETLLEATAILKERGNAVTVAIYGKPARPEDGQYLDELKSLAEKLDIKDVVHWMGAIANKESPQAYAKGKMFVRTQGGGGFGKVDLESMSMGIPVVLPTAVYKKDLGDFGEETFFPEDDAAALAGRVRSVLAWDEAKRSRYADLARGIVAKKHNVENVAEAIVSTIRTCVA